MKSTALEYLNSSDMESLNEFSNVLDTNLPIKRINKRYSIASHSVEDRLVGRNIPNIYSKDNTFLRKHCRWPQISWDKVVFLVTLCLLLPDH